MTREPERDLSSYFPRTDGGYPLMTILRLVLSPMWEEEVISPIQIGSRELLETIYRIGHDSEVKLFTYTRPKSADVQGSELSVEQIESSSRRGESEYVRLIVPRSGTITLASSVTGRLKRESRFNIVDSHVIAVEDVKTVFHTFFRFLDALYGDLDPFRRHEQFFYNASLRGRRYKLMKETPQPLESTSMSMRSGERVVAYDTSRRIERAALGLPDDEIDRTIAMLRRTAAEQ